MKKYKFKSDDKIGIVANDAGAANLIMGWVLHNKFLNYYFCLSGPAKKIFREKNLCNSIYDLDAIIEKCNTRVCATYNKGGNTFGWDIIVADKHLTKVKKILRGHVESTVS